MDIVKLWTLCSSNGIILEADMRDNITRYATELKYWNSKVNLISRKDEDNIFERHILHSLSILKFIDPKPKARVVDIGTGGGLPGIPVKIARPDLFMYLIDSIAKKTKMTEMLANHTGLKNIRTINARAEHLHQELDVKFDLVIARAVAPARKIFNWTQKIIKPNAKYALLKGGDLDMEIFDLEEFATDYSITVHPLNLVGYEEFNKDEKKIIILEKK
ncbi:16S rRNA (guanine(527)-N(7))-methyltransferase RsmG [Candidatus Kapabacteria bacterium]|nr:16S rRNA (guanine(527)-N(7))-methyltransferase RsmG [Candidatus Kapabacteria bacterium]